MREGRREFIQIVILGGAGLAAAACGGGDGGSDTTQQPATRSCSANGGTASAISANHGHVLEIPVAHFSDGLDHEYSIQGTALHDHLVALTAAQLAAILGGGTETVTSTETNVHTHMVTAICGTSAGGGGGIGGGGDPYP
jgi:hypothetical protein